jgi:kojibiose phosphorylase
MARWPKLIDRSELLTATSLTLKENESLHRMTKLLSSADWLVTEAGLELENINYFESVFTIGNGYQGTRGSLEEGLAGELSGTYLAGVYDHHDSNVIDLVNAPSWLPVTIRVGGHRLDAQNCRVIEHSRTLDLYTGLLHRSTLFEDKAGRRTRLRSTRLCSFADQHICGQRLEITAENHDSDVSVESRIDGNRYNLECLPAYKDAREIHREVKWEKWAKSRHLETQLTDAKPDGAYLQTNTIDTGVTIGVASMLACSDSGIDCTALVDYKSAGQVASFKAHSGASYAFENLSAIYTSRDLHGADIRQACSATLSDATSKGFDKCAEESAAVWAKKWDDCDCTITGDVEATRAVRFNIYHLLITANENDPRANIGAKSLSGEGYRGHVFWDTEVFLLPFYIYTQPSAARALILYRYNTLDGAIRNAKGNGFSGAQYPWESADSGVETTPKWTHDGVHRIWTGEEEIHITACVAYGVMTYLTATDDWEFMRDYGAEMLYQTSRFWISLLEYKEEKDRFELTKVIGPDEFHEHIDNNTFTNRLAQWHLDKAVEIFVHLDSEQTTGHDALVAKLGISKKEVAEWSETAAKIYIPADPERNLVEQFEGYFDLEDLPITKWDENHMPLYPEGRDHFTLNDAMILKQPDVIMLMYMLPDEFSDAAKKANYEFYEKRTMHKSSLSPAIHAIMGIEVGDHSTAHRYFERSAYVDLVNNQGNTEDGIHIASAGGTWQSVVCGFGGFRVRQGQMTFKPWLPAQWEDIRFTIQWRGKRLHVTIGQSEFGFLLEGNEEDVETIQLFDKQVTLVGGRTTEISRDQ